MSHELSQCRQAGCTDAETELLRRAFLADLAKATKPQPGPGNRVLIALAVTSSTAANWRSAS